MNLANLCTKTRINSPNCREQSRGRCCLFSLHHVINTGIDAESLPAGSHKMNKFGIDGVPRRDVERSCRPNLFGPTSMASSPEATKLPARRGTYIPKADGSKRPLGIPTLKTRWRSGRL